MSVYHIQTPEFSASIIGLLQPSPTPGLVLLCRPDGKPLMELPEAYVQRSSPEEMAKRILDDIKHERERKLRRN